MSHESRLDNSNTPNLKYPNILHIKITEFYPNKSTNCVQVEYNVGVIIANVPAYAFAMYLIDLPVAPSVKVLFCHCGNGSTAHFFLKLSALILSDVFS